MLVKLAIKTAIAVAFVGELFQVSGNIAHLIYPMMGLLTTMQSSLGLTVKKAWGRLAGSAIGGAIGAWLVVTLGTSPAIAGLAFALAALICEGFQLQAPYSQAGTIAALVAAQLFGDNPWFYTFSRVMDNWIGVMIGIAITLIFWSENPRQTLSDNLIQVLHNTDQLFQAIIDGYCKETKQVVAGSNLLNEISSRIQKSKSVLNQEMYGIVGSHLAQENWSDLLAIEMRLHRYLATMLKTVQKLDSSLFHQFAEPLTQLAQQFSTTCTALIQTVQSTDAAKSNLLKFRLAAGTTRNSQTTVPEISTLKSQLQSITDQINQMRTTEAIHTHLLQENQRFYVYFHNLNALIQTMEQLTTALLYREKIATQRSAGGGSGCCVEQAQSEMKPDFRWHPVPFERIRFILKTGIAVWLCLVILNDWLHMPFNYYAVVAVVVAMQPTFGKAMVAGSQRVIVTGIGAIYAVLIVNTLGGTPFSLALGIFLVILTCTYLGFSQGYVTGCILLSLSIMAHGNQPNAYIWGRFLETLLGTIIALILSQFFWSNTSSQQLNQEISQTFTQMGNLYTMLVNSYLKGLEPEATIAPINKTIQKSLKTHTSLQKETQQEPVYNLMAPKAQREWNLLLSYEKELFENLEALHDAVQQYTGTPLPQDLRDAIEISVQASVLSFNQLAKATGQRRNQQKISSPLSTFEAIEQALLNLRTTGAGLTYSLDQVLSLMVVTSAMRETAENLDQLSTDLRIASN